MKTVYDTIIAVRKATGKNDKLAILQKQENNKDLKEFLRVCYEPRINFYQSKVPVVKKLTGPTVSFTAKLVSEIIATLHDRELTGNAAKEWLGQLSASFKHDWERELLEMLIERDVKSGFSTSTINKVWKDLVTDVPYMRCSLFKDSKIKEFKWHDGAFSQVKADGMFANIDIKDRDNITIMSRNGSPFPLEEFNEIVKEIRDDLVKPRDLQLHGELLVKKGKDILPRQESNGMLNKLLKGGALPAGHRVIYKVWDVIPLSSAVAGGSYKVPYHARWDVLESMFPERGDGAITRIKTKRVYSVQEAKDHYIECLEAGEEGTVLKDAYAIWEDKTSKWQVKFKLEVTVELRVKGFKPGRNKFEGKVGSLECESQDGKLEVNVSGFPDDLRDEITANFKSDWMGSIVAVTSNSIMPERNGTYSLFLPRFAEQRLDKKKADTLKQIQDQFEAALKNFGG
jgi:DNA ligase-1